MSDESSPPAPSGSPAGGAAVAGDGPGRLAARYLHVQVSDPDHQLLHRGLRAAIGQFALMLVGVIVVDNGSFTLFAAFGSFAVLGLAELGGRRSARPRAYAGLAAAGAVGIAAGTLASENVVAGAGVMLLGVFALQFATVFGGYIAAAEPAVLLVLVLGVMVPGRPSDLAARELGWLAACALAVVLASVLWPPPDTRVVSDAYARVCRGIAAVLRGVGRHPAAPRAGGPPPPAGDGPPSGATTPDTTVADVAAAMTASRALVLTQPNRPAGPTEHDQALNILADELSRTIGMLGRLEQQAAAGPTPVAPAQRALGDVVAKAFEASAEGLERREPPTLTPVEIDQARDRHLEAVTAWIEHEIAVCDDPTPIVATTRRVFPLRVLSLSAVSINANVSILGGMEVDTDPLVVAPHVPGGSGPGATGQRARRILADHFHPNTVWFRNSARAAVALTVALCVAQLGEFNHAFWIVLGSLSVLRSNALGTSRTAFEAILGNLLGFAAAALVLVLAGDRTVVLWCVLPFAIFLSAYTPQAIHFVIGQASFGLLVVVLFNVLAPAGIITGIERVQNVVIGAGLSVVVAFLFWPRGAGAALRTSVAALYRADAAFLAGAVRDTLAADRDDVVVDRAREQRRRDLDAARRQANAAYGSYLNERGSKRMEKDDWGTMFGCATGMRLAGDSIEQLVAFGFSSRHLATPRVTDAHHALAGAWQQRITALSASADALTPPAHRTSTDPPPVVAGDGAAAAAGSREELDHVVARALRDAHRADDLRPALGLVFLTAWLGVIDDLLDTIHDPVQRAEQTNARPWYR